MQAVFKQLLFRFAIGLRKSAAISECSIALFHYYKLLKPAKEQPKYSAKTTNNLVDAISR